MQVKSIPSREFLHTAWEGTGYQGVLEMRSLMIFEMLLQLELFATVLTLEVS